MTEPGPIVLLTDFGARDGYVGVMKGVILRINPRASIVDLSHDIAPQDVGGAAFVLGTSYRFFPSRSVFVAVVDPGVGGSRRAVAIETGDVSFVGPDTGIFSWVLDELKLSDYRAVELTARCYWLAVTSATFHGRDVFAPVAAHLSLGVPIANLGPSASDLVTLRLPRPRPVDGGVEGEIIRIDRFGNLITNIREADISWLDRPAFEVAGHRLVGLRPSYEETSDIGAILGRAGLIEIAVRNESAAEAIGAGVGTKVLVRQVDGR